MSIKLLVRKLYMEDERYIDNTTLKEYCKSLKLDYYTVIRYLISNKYLHRILRGIFYKPSIEERKLGKVEENLLHIISKALRIKKISNWYFGLESAIKIHNLSHEFFPIIYIINDKIFRHKPITILGNKVKFVKLKKTLFGFGTKKENRINYSDIEKTVLDIIYISRYGGSSDKEIESKINNLLKHCSKKKLLMYVKKYNKSVNKFVEGLSWKN